MATEGHKCPRCGAPCKCYADLRNLNGYDGCNHHCPETKD